MPEAPQNNQSDFIMIEKIKERPINGSLTVEY